MLDNQERKYSVYVAKDDLIKAHIYSYAHSVLVKILNNEEVKNTNRLLWNTDNVKGLKTGSTNKAGNCLVTLLEINSEQYIYNRWCLRQ